MTEGVTPTHPCGVAPAVSARMSPSAIERSPEGLWEDRAVPSLFASYLRVYEPLSAFNRDRQRYWRRYVQEGRAVAPGEGPQRQRSAVIDALGSGWTRLPDLPDEAYVMETEDTLLVCPWSLRVRVAEAALHARDGVPPVLADAFVPATFAGLARAVIETWPAENRTIHEQVATWGVPLRWFVFVDAAERQVSTRGRRLLRYRTEISKARRRAHRGLVVLRRSVGEAPITEAVEEGTRWLEQFHPRSMLELDYGGLVDLLGDEQLAADDSPELVAAGLAGLARGDADAATEAYEKLVARWRAVQLFERAN